MCGCNKNQTPVSVFESMIAAGANFRSDEVKGIGLFVVPAPERGILEYRSVAVEGISYSECMKRGNNCEAFQWLPLGVKITHEQKSFTVNSLQDLEAMQSFDCNDSCRGGCPMGCTCFNNDVWCRRNN
jgi:hypothetical protein